MFGNEESSLGRYYDHQSIAIVTSTYPVLAMFIGDCNQLLIFQYQIAIARSSDFFHHRLAIFVNAVHAARCTAQQGVGACAVPAASSGWYPP